MYRIDVRKREEADRKILTLKRKVKTNQISNDQSSNDNDDDNNTKVEGVPVYS